MSILERDNEWGPASPDELAQLESATGWKLPPSYRAFLLASNGGSPKKRSSFVYLAGDGEPPKVAESFDSLLSQLGSWTVPGDPEWLKAIELDEGDKVIRMLDEGLNPGVRYDGRSIVEYAAVHAQNDLIESLVDRGAVLGDALLLAEQNAEFFPRHIETVALLRRLTPA